MARMAGDAPEYLSSALMKPFGCKYMGNPSVAQNYFVIFFFRFVLFEAKAELFEEFAAVTVRKKKDIALYLSNS